MFYHADLKSAQTLRGVRRTTWASSALNLTGGVDPERANTCPPARTLEHANLTGARLYRGEPYRRVLKSVKVVFVPAPPAP